MAAACHKEKLRGSAGSSAEAQKLRFERKLSRSSAEAQRKLSGSSAAPGKVLGLLGLLAQRAPSEQCLGLLGLLEQVGLTSLDICQFVDL